MSEPEQSPYTSFEEAFEAAENASDRLERGDLTLEASLKEYERGARALRECYRMLETAQSRLEVLRSETRSDGNDSDSAAWVVAKPSGPLEEVLRHLGQEGETPQSDGASEAGRIVKE